MSSGRTIQTITLVVTLRYAVALTANKSIQHIGTDVGGMIVLEGRHHHYLLS